MREFLVGTDWWTDCDDAMALRLLALTGDETAAGYDTVRGRASVDPETGCNHFTQAPDGPHCFVVKNRPDGFYQRAINEKIKTMRK